MITHRLEGRSPGSEERSPESGFDTRASAMVESKIGTHRIIQREDTD